MEGESKQSIEKKKLLNSNYIIININTSNTLKMFIVSWSNALHIREQFKLIHNPDMKTSAKHFRVYAPQAHDTQTKLKVFRSSVLALNKIDNLDIPFNSPELLIFSKVTARHCLRIFVNSRVVTCSCKLSLTNLWGYKKRLTIDTRQNQVKVSNHRQFTTGTSFIAGYQRKLGQIKNIYRRKCYLRNSK